MIKVSSIHRMLRLLKPDQSEAGAVQIPEITGKSESIARKPGEIHEQIAIARRISW
jgi:hypothetical protein